MKQRIGWIAAIAIATLGFYVPYSLAQGSSGKPFDDVWKAIADVKNQIATISLTPGPQGSAGPQGTKGDKGEPGEPGSGGGASLHLYDADGQDLGVVVRASADARQFSAYRPEIDGVIDFSQDRLNGSEAVKLENDGNIYFSEENCTGQAYTGGLGIPGGIVAAPIPQGYKLFKFTSDDLFGSFQRKSILQVNGCFNSTVIVRSIGRVDEVLLPFTFPLAFPLEIK